jgi:uncharacterized membrane protein (UPF0182 family)
MPELRLVVLALQDRLVYGPTFEAAMAGLFGGGDAFHQRCSGDAVGHAVTGGAQKPPGTARPKGNPAIL